MIAKAICCVRRGERSPTVREDYSTAVLFCQPGAGRLIIYEYSYWQAQLRVRQPIFECGRDHNLMLRSIL